MAWSGDNYDGADDGNRVHQQGWRDLPRPAMARVAGLSVKRCDQLTSSIRDRRGRQKIVDETGRTSMVNTAHVGQPGPLPSAYPSNSDNNQSGKDDRAKDSPADAIPIWRAQE